LVTILLKKNQRKLSKIMEVESIGSNQIEVRKENGVFLVSYKTVVAGFVKDCGKFRTEDNYSATTNRHISKWLNGVNAIKIPQAVLEGYFDA